MLKVIAGAILLWILIAFVVSLLVGRHFRRLQVLDDRSLDVELKSTSHRLEREIKKETDFRVIDHDKLHDRVTVLERIEDALTNCEGCGAIFVRTALAPRRVGGRGELCIYCVQKQPAPVQAEIRRAVKAQRETS